MSLRAFSCPALRSLPIHLRSLLMAVSSPPHPISRLPRRASDWPRVGTCPCRGREALATASDSPTKTKHNKEGLTLPEALWPEGVMHAGRAKQQTSRMSRGGPPRRFNMPFSLPFHVALSLTASPLGPVGKVVFCTLGSPCKVFSQLESQCRASDALCECGWSLHRLLSTPAARNTGCRLR